MNFVLIATGRFLKSSVIVLDSKMNYKLLPELDGVKITQTAPSLHEGHQFALDEKNNLIALNLSLLCHGDGHSPYQVMDFTKFAGGSVISIDQQNIWALHASGEMHKLQAFAGALPLEEFGEENEEFLVWRQIDHFLAAVSRFNVMSIWDTLTGRLISKTVLEEHD